MIYHGPNDINLLGETVNVTAHGALADTDTVSFFNEVEHALLLKMLKMPTLRAVCGLCPPPKPKDDG